MRRFFIEHSKVPGSTVVITGPDSKHITSVLRLKPGDLIGLLDGTGVAYEAKIATASSNSVEVEILRAFSAAAESPVRIMVAQAFLKEKKMDLLVRQLTELGITTWIPFFSERSVPRPDKNRLHSRTERWEKIAREALKQCERTSIPEIGAAVSFEEVLRLGKACDLKIAFWENESKPIGAIISSRQNRPVNRIFVLLGPEGGFSPQEMEKARAFGFETAGLGPRILRAETATIAACALLQYLFGDMGQPGR